MTENRKPWDEQGLEDSPEENPEDNLVVLTDEEGEEFRFRILFDSLFVDESQYVVLMPAEQLEEAEPEIVVLRIDEADDGENCLVTIDDDDEWEKVLAAFAEISLEGDFVDYDVEIDSET